MMFQMNCQGTFYRNGVTTIPKFSSFFRSEDDLVTVLKESFNTDSDHSLAGRSQVASVICAWRETQTRQKRQIEVEAEMDTMLQESGQSPFLLLTIST